MGYSSLIITCTLSIIGRTLADCTNGAAGDLFGQPKKFMDITLQPSAYPVPMYFPNQCLTSIVPSGLKVTACSTQDHPQVMVQNTENAFITCPRGCIVSAYDYCKYGFNKPDYLPEPVVSPMSADGSDRNVYNYGQ